MNAEHGVALPVPEEQLESNVLAGTQYKRVLKTTEEQAQEAALPVDFRRVQHGHGPCSCCGPYSE